MSARRLPGRLPRRRRRTLLSAALLVVGAAALTFWSQREPAPPPAAPPALPAALPGAGSMGGATIGAPPGYRAIPLPAGPTSVHDGDTFDADLDGDGRVEPPRERVRLLFVDTPELSKSWKGKDPAHGLPARDFLRQQLAARPLVLYVPLERSQGRYGRTLALVQAGDAWVNLALIRAGLSPFDTRFGFPADYAAYAAAEGAAFDERLGIWADADSRQRYLERLRKEQKTPAGRSNPAYLADVQPGERLRPAALIGRYVRVDAEVREVVPLSKGVLRIRIARAPDAGPLPVIALPRTAKALDVAGWPAGLSVRLEGFLQVYRGRPELLLHHAQPRP